MAYRYFFVWDPVVVRVSGAEMLEGRVPLLPGNPDAGHRVTVLEKEDDDFIYLNITSEDLAAMNPGDIVRLKDLGNFKLSGEKEFEYIGNDLNVIKQGVKIIHLTGSQHINTRVHMPDGETIIGFAELDVMNSIGQVVQYERFGFLRLERSEEGVEGYFAHK